MLTTRPLFPQLGYARGATAAAGIMLVVALTGVSPFTPPTADAAEAEQSQLSLADFWRPILRRPPEATPSTAPPMSPLARLGERLFFDNRLSANADMSCATCHQPAHGFADPTPRRIGRGGKPLRHHVPSLLNVGWAKALEWDGTITRLEDQMDRPLTSPAEMASTWPELVARLAADRDLSAEFSRIFSRKSDPVSRTSIEAALAAYERTLLPPETRFDRSLNGDTKALSDEEQQGFAIFAGKAGCISCHAGWRFTDDARHDIGLPVLANGSDTDPAPSPWKKTPGLRGLHLTAPYMHDGRFATIEAVVTHYLSPKTSTAAGRHPLGTRFEDESAPISTDEKTALIAFLRTL